MNNFVASAQRFLKNKNTITIIGVIIILVLLYIGYSGQINKAVEPIKVPVAVETIQPRTEITDDMVELVDMPNISISDNVLRTKNAVVGKYSNINSVIPRGSMFYTDTVVDKSKLPDSVFVKVKKGEKVLLMKVDTETTYGNSIFPGNVIDLYMKVGNGTDEKVMVGKLVSNVTVLAVKDSSGKDVFENTSENRTPAMMIIGVPEEIHTLLTKAIFMESLGVEMFMVPQGGTVDKNGATEVSTQQLADYIEAHAVNIPVPTPDPTKDELLPTIKEDEKSPKTVTITYPKGCGSKYTCTYTKDNGKATKVTKTTQTLKYTTAGTLIVTVTEKDGTAHTADFNITVGATNNTTDTNSNNQVVQ